MKKIVSFVIAILSMAIYAAPQQQDNRLYSLDQFFKPGSVAAKCVGKRLYGRAVVLSSEPDQKAEGKFIVTLGEILPINGQNRDYFRILRTKAGKIVYARLFFKVRVSEAAGMRAKEGQIFSITGRVGSYSEVVEKEHYPNDNLYQGSDKIKFTEDHKFHGFYLFIPEGGTLTY